MDFDRAFLSVALAATTFFSGAAMAAADRIVIGTSGGVPRFVRQSTGQPVSPRGVNWNRSAFRTDLSGAQEYWYHTFDVGAYDANDVENSFAQLQSSGYDYVRVFVAGQDPDNGFGMSVPGISSGYLSNIADLLNRAKNHNLLVVLTGEFEKGRYLPLNYLPQTSGVANTQGSNNLVFNPSYASALGQFYHDLIAGLKTYPGDPTTALFAIDMYNEIAVNKQEQPLSLGSGNYVFNGGNYNLGDNNSRQNLIDNAATIWANTVASAIRSVDSVTLVSGSLYTIGATGNAGFNGASLADGGDGRYALKPAAIANSIANYVDIHFYADYASSYFATEMQKEALGNLASVKPIIMGEVGSFKGKQGDRASATSALNRIIVSSCNIGFTGWGFWTWDQTGSTANDTWSLVEQNGAINAYFAPTAHADICQSVVAGAAVRGGSTQAAGFFQTGGTIYYSNGFDAYCGFANWDDYINSGGAPDQSNVAQPGGVPTGFWNDGACYSPPVPAGFFSVPNSGIFYSNGSHYCQYNSWQAYLNAGGAPDQSNVRHLTANPPNSMVNDGICQ